MYLFIEIRHTILKQRHRNYIGAKTVNFILEIDFLRNYKKWVPLRGDF